MKKMKKQLRLTGVVAIAMALMIAFSGVALASPFVPKTPETEILAITTIIKCNGTVVENEELGWESSSKNLIDNPPLAAGEIYGQIKYDEIMIGLDGDTNFIKDFGVDTGIAPNLNVMKTIGYASGDLGSLSHAEEVGMKIIAAGKPAGTTTTGPLCPFDPPITKGTPAVPGSCEEVNAYSTMVVTDVAAITITEVGVTKTPVKLLYEIAAGGDGTVAAGMSISVADGHGAPPALGSKMSYKEKSIADGEFTFTKEVGYKSVYSP